MCVTPAQFEALRTCNTTATLKNAKVNTSQHVLNISIFVGLPDEATPMKVTNLPRGSYVCYICSV